MKSYDAWNPTISIYILAHYNLSLHWPIIKHGLYKTPNNAKCTYQSRGINGPIRSNNAKCTYQWPNQVKLLKIYISMAQWGQANFLIIYQYEIIRLFAITYKPYYFVSFANLFRQTVYMFVDISDQSIRNIHVHLIAQVEIANPIITKKDWSI